MEKMEITGFIKVGSVSELYSCFAGTKCEGVCVRHRRDEFIGKKITTLPIKNEHVINDKTKLVRTESGSMYLIFCD